MTLFAPLIPIISKELRISYSSIGMIIFSTTLGFVISNLISGMLADKFGKKIISALGFLITGLGIVTLAFAQTHMQFLTFYTIAGFGNGAWAANLQAIIADIYPLDRSKRILRLNIYFAAGAGFGPLIVSIILSQNMDWRIFFGLIGAVNFIIFLFYATNRYPLELTAHESIKGNIKRLFNPIIIICGLILFFYIGIEATYSTWMTTYLTTFKIPVQLGSLSVSAFWFFMAIGIWSSEFLSKKIHDVKIIFASTVLVFISITSIILFNSLPVIFVFTVLLGISLSPVFPLTASTAISQDPEISGTISGFTMSFPLAASIIFQPLVGYVSDIYGTGKSIFVQFYLSIVYVTSALILLILFFRRGHPRKILS
jgi:MFS family permease